MGLGFGKLEVVGNVGKKEEETGMNVFRIYPLSR